jgi:hypothetical protein
MRNRILLIASMFLVFALCASAADVTGKWVAQVPGRDGQTREMVFNLKSAGDNVTGTQSGGFGGGGGGAEIPITDGKSSGDSISFKVNMERGGNTITWTYTGTVSGSEMKLKREGGRGPQEIVAKKQ